MSRRVWTALTLAALAGYAALSWALMAAAPASPWTVAALFGPLLAALVVSGVVRRSWPTIAAAVLAAALLAWLAQTGGGAGSERLNVLYVLQHAGVHALLGSTFALTLRPGATPLITLLAERVHRHFTPAMRAYTRRLTRAWAVYFAAMIAVSLLLYAAAPWPWWSFFCNVLTPLAVAVMFVGEHVLRYRLHPEFERVTLADAVRVYRAFGP